MSADYPLVPLREVCSFRHGGTPSKSNPAFWGGDIPWVSPKDMKSSVLTSTQDSITPDGVTGSATSIVPEGAILVVARSGILAHTLPVAIAGRPLTFNQDIKAIQVTDARLSSAYVYWFLKGKAPEVIAKGVKKGATVHSLVSGFLERLRIPMASPSEQRRIVELLSRAENIVRMRREAEATAKEIVPALFLDMYGDPATNPKGWEVRTIGELCARKPNYGTMIPGNEQDGSWLCLRVANIQDHGLSLADKKFVDLPAEAQEKHEVLDGDILLARAIGSLDHLGKCIVAKPGSERWAFDSHLMRVRLHQALASPDWLTTLLRTRGGRSLFLANVRRGAVQFNVNTGELMRIRVPVPPIQLQREYAERVGRMHGLENQQTVATTQAESTFQSLLAGVFEEGA